MDSFRRFASWYRYGSDGPVLRETRVFLTERGYLRSTPKRDAGVRHEEVYEGAVVSILIWLDRATDWYVEAKPRDSDTGWWPIDSWGPCLGFQVLATVELEPQITLLREHLEHFESACASERLQSTLDCLRQPS